MEITLEKIELVKDRTGVTYAEAKQALEENDGSVVDAIIDIEETVNASRKDISIGEKSAALFTSLKELVQKGNVARIQVKKDGEIVLNMPLNAGIVGIAIAPLAAVIGAVAAFGFKCSIEVIKTDGTIIDVSDAVSETVNNVAERGSEAAEIVKDKANEIYEMGKNYADEYGDKLKDSEFYEKAKDKADGLKDKAEDLADDLKDKAKDKADELKGKADEFLNKAEEEAGEAVEEAEEAVEEAAAEAEEVVEEAEAAVEEEVAEAAEEVKEAAEEE
jgi:ElaB/YqjD/DUF883 family membrane-anchored ribosome-binding protein